MDIILNLLLLRIVENSPESYVLVIILLFFELMFRSENVICLVHTTLRSLFLILLIINRCTIILLLRVLLLMFQTQSLRCDILVGSM